MTRETVQPKRPAKAGRVRVVGVAAGQRKQRTDTVAVEEPMEIRVAVGRARHSVAITMRTPGHDFELAAGFLFSEGVIANRQSITRISYCTSHREPQHFNIVNVHLAPGASFDPAKLSRHVFASSSCGVCGKATLEQLRSVVLYPLARTPQLRDEVLLALPATARAAQTLFATTGGLHAAALFDVDGKLLVIREDVGRHNAMDKLIGARLLEDRLPAANTIVLVSGRASFELVQKAILAGIPALAAVGAPSSLAVELAEEFGMTLIGFLRDGRYNIYNEA